jgi:hypothetical protein
MSATLGSLLKESAPEREIKGAVAALLGASLYKASGIFS